MTAMMTKDRSLTRREVLLMTAVAVSVLPSLGCTHEPEVAKIDGQPLPNDVMTTTDTTPKLGEPKLGETMQVHYIEIVTADVEAYCQLYSQIHGVTFGDSDPSLGGARTTRLANGGMMGIRAPMHDGEKLVTRAYMLVEDIEAAVAMAAKSGAEIAVPPMTIPGHGTCAIFFQGGIETGLWQL